MSYLVLRSCRLRSPFEKGPDLIMRVTRPSTNASTIATRSGVHRAFEETFESVTGSLAVRKDVSRNSFTLPCSKFIHSSGHNITLIERAEIEVRMD